MPFICLKVLTLKIGWLKAQDHKSADHNDKCKHPSKNSLVLGQHFQRKKYRQTELQMGENLFD